MVVGSATFWARDLVAWAIIIVIAGLIELTVQFRRGRTKRVALQFLVCTSR
jgi:hypothetical protein